MGLRVAVKPRASVPSDRVKCVDFLDSGNWLLVSCYNGHILIYDYELDLLVRTLEVGNLPVRCARFIGRRQSLICGCDDFNIRVYNYNTGERLWQWEGHGDYVRCLAVHPTHPWVLSGSDDMLIKLWDMDKQWLLVAQFEGHSHYVMSVAWHPTNSTTFGSCGLDRVIKIWSVGSKPKQQCNYTLSGHTRGVNAIIWSPQPDRPYIISGSDDSTLRVWDAQTNQCTQTLDGHEGNVVGLCYHHFLPIFMSVSEDGCIKVWNAYTFRLENTLTYDFERPWAIAMKPASNYIGVGFDKGYMILQVGLDVPLATMHNGKIILCRGSTIQTGNVKLLDDPEAAETWDMTSPDDMTMNDKIGDSLEIGGKEIHIPWRDLGDVEIFVQNVSYNQNGRFVCVYGEGEYTIYTSQALRNKSYGRCIEFVWSNDNSYAILTDNGRIIIYDNFQEISNFLPFSDVTGIHGGHCLAIRGREAIYFYDWKKQSLIRKIDIKCKNIIWDNTGKYLTIICDAVSYIMEYDAETVAGVLGANMTADEGGIEAAFTLIDEVTESIYTGIWIGGLFIFVSNVLRLQAWYGEEAHDPIGLLEKKYHIVGHHNNSLYLVTSNLHVLQYTINIHYILAKRAILTEKGNDEIKKHTAHIPKRLLNDLARFAETCKHFDLAINLTRDPAHKVSLYLRLRKLHEAYLLLAGNTEAAPSHRPPAPIDPHGTCACSSLWKDLASLALREGDMDMALAGFYHAKDYETLFILFLCLNDGEGMQWIYESIRSQKQNRFTDHDANEHFSIYFQTAFIMEKYDEVISLLTSSQNPALAALVCVNYTDRSNIETVVDHWQKKLTFFNGSTLKIPPGIGA